MSPERKTISSFGWLNITQFLGALNDNVFKLMIILFIVNITGKGQLNTVQALATFIFVIPFLLFSHAAGVLADRFSKRHIIVAAKWAELGVMLTAAVALYIGNPYLLYSLLFIMCAQSAFFGPSKYGIIPELVEDHRLSKANSFLVSLSYLAIIVGTFIPSLFLDKIFYNNFYVLAGFCVLIALLGLIASHNIEVTPARGEHRRITPFFVVDVFKTLFSLKNDRYLQMAVIGIAYFTFLGAFIQQTLLYYGVKSLGISPVRSAYFFPVAALGIGIGALLAGKLSGRNIEIGVVPIGALGLTICCIALNIIPPTVIALLIVVCLLGVASGLFIVPLNAFIQHQAPPERRGEILACDSFMSFLGVAISAGVFILLARILKLSPGQCFAVVGLLTGILTIATFVILPDFLIRLIVISVTRLFYRITSGGLDNLPVKGGALLISNHVTWVDSMLIAATQQRRIVFMMERSIYNTWWIKPIFKLMKVIPVSTSDNPRRIIESLQSARALIEKGYLVCIFAEGALTRNGNMRAFRGGFERILKDSNYPIIPVHIGGAWGSIFSHYHGKILSSLPHRIPYPVTVLFGKSLPPTASPMTVRTAICELSCDAVNLRKDKKRTLNQRFIRKARQSWFRLAIIDSSGKKLTFGKTLAGSIALSDAIHGKLDKDEDKVGIIMPASVGGALANTAIMIMGRVPVNLNFTASTESMCAAIKQCKIKTIISSRAFLAKLPNFEVPEGTLYLEDIMPTITTSKRLRAFFKALFSSPTALAHGRHIKPDDLATIIFSSGSTSLPKGVMLSHHNIISNVESLGEVFKFGKEDRFCAVLPFFHSFGLTATLWAPMITGFTACYHPNPLDGKIIGEMIRENKLTVMVATPTFLLSYIRRADADDFKTMRALITGAEKLKPRIADAFEKKFGFRPVEGYGATELSPVAALSQHNVEISGVKQIGIKEGSVGQAMPGIAARIVDPDSFEILPVNTEGLLQIKGPNVMLGYLNRDDLTREVVHNGWYNTGDIARIDKDGFIFLVDRLSRYSKIGGEMVPHMAVEDVLTENISTVEPSVVVTAAPDERKGEQLVVCYTPEAGSVEDLQAAIKASNIPNLWKPKKDNYILIDKIPTLGSGKIDLKRVKEIAREFIELRPGKIQRTVDKITHRGKTQ